MTLQILTVSSEPTAMTLTLDGHLDAVTTPKLEQFIAAHLSAGIKTLVLNLNRLAFISSAGLRIFAKTQKTMQSRGGKLCFVNLSPQVRKVFDIVKAVPGTSIFRNDEELDSYLASMQYQVSEDEPS